MALTDAYRRLTAREDARSILDRNGLSVTRIIRVDSDCILYLNLAGLARTCWLHVPEHGPMRFRMEQGFPAEAPAGWHEALEGD